MTGLSSSVTIVVRSVGERTEAVCIKLLQEIFPESRVELLKNISPFSETVRHTFELAANCGTKWLLSIDADVLPDRQGLLDLVERGEQAEPTVFELQGKVLDKLFGGPRPAGVHLYRTEFAQQAIQFIPKPEESLRPESYTIRRMAEVGYVWRQLEMMTGLHDFEQSFNDLLRKAFVHSRKHKKYMPVISEYWRRMSETDSDYSIALAAYEFGTKYKDTITIDSSAVPQELVSKLGALQLEEKSELEEYTLVQVAEVIKQHLLPPEFIKFEKMAGITAYSLWETILMKLGIDV